MADSDDARHAEVMEVRPGPGHVLQLDGGVHMHNLVGGRNRARVLK